MFRGHLRRISFVLAACLVFVAGCHEEGPTSVEIRTGDDPVAFGVHQGLDTELAMPDYNSLLVILEGSIAGGEPGVDVAEVFDADVYAGPHNPAGDPHVITRARVVDDEGNTLWTQPVASLFQSIEMLSLVIEQLSPVDLDVEWIYEMARDDYPELLRFPVRVPANLEGAQTVVLELAGESGRWSTIDHFAIDDLQQRAVKPDPDFHFEVDSIVDNGPSSDQIDFVILGDGYTEQERSKFEADAQAIADRMLETAPFDEHADLFNVHSIWTPSAESGAGFDCNHSGADDDCEQRFRDTRFDTTFVIPAIAAEYNYPTDDISDRVAMPLQMTDIYEVSAMANYDEIIMVSNTDKFSGFASGYSVAMVTNFDDRDRFLDTAVHEVGHTLGFLGDEYTNPADACYYNEPTVPLPRNIDLVEDDTVKWSEWISDTTPLPTPDYMRDVHETGAFEGAYNCDFLVRPAFNCKMNSSTEEFCPICAETMVRRFYTATSVTTSDPPTATIDGDDLLLTLPVREDAGDRYQIIWVVDGDIHDEHSATLALPKNSLSSVIWSDVKATVRNQSDTLHTPHHTVEKTFEFQVIRR